MLTGRHRISVLLQYFDAAQPKAAEKPEAAAGADLGALIAAEVQDLKSSQGRLFSYVKTNVNGLLYLQMQRDVGALPQHVLLQLRPVESGAWPALTSCAVWSRGARSY